tara:strand:+ start:9565 stop:10419 length:855 start_codon:yes stop_codon:yes gene_type:complete
MTRGSNLQVYKGFDIAELERQDALLGATTKVGGGDFYKWQEGKNVVRFLPLPADSEQTSPFVIVQEHFYERPDGTKQRFACPRLMEKKKCPLCDLANELKRSGNQVDSAKAREFYPKARIYANVIDRSGDQSKPQIISFGKTVWQGLLAIMRDDVDGGDFTNPSDDGFDIIILREGQGLKTQYKVRAARNDSAVEDLDVIKRQWDLQKYCTPPSLEQVLTWMGAEAPDNSMSVPQEDEIIIEPKQLTASTQQKRKSKQSTKGKKRATASLTDLLEDDEEDEWDV